MLNFNLPGTFSEVAHKPIMLSFNFIGQTGTAILITIIITVLMAKKVSFGDAGRLFGVTFKELWLPVLTICFILAISKITTYGGLSAAMGQGIAKAGNVFPVLSPILGWIGVFMTGSVVNNNSLFAPIQASSCTTNWNKWFITSSFKHSWWCSSEINFTSINSNCDCCC